MNSPELTPTPSPVPAPTPASKPTPTSAPVSPQSSTSAPAPPVIALLVPSRGRPRKLRRLYEACERTCVTKWHFYIGLDEDDPCLHEYYAFFRDADTRHLEWWVDTRTGLGPWTNRLTWAALDRPWRPDYFVSIGDDMVPRTPGWDQALVDAMPPGGGFTYPDDLRRSDVPEIVMTTARIVHELGYFAEPTLQHWYLDNVWRDLGTMTNSLVYVPGAVVAHMHPNVPGGDKPDGTYHEAAELFDSDLGRYQRWRFKRMRDDAAAVVRARTAEGDPERHAGPSARPVHVGPGMAGG